MRTKYVIVIVVIRILAKIMTILRLKVHRLIYLGWKKYPTDIVFKFYDV